MRSDVQLVPGPPLDPRYGAVAQLGERVLCKHEVVGSIPIGSTTPGGQQQNSSTETISFGARKCASRKIIDIVKAGLAGSHNRLIHTTLKTDRIDP